MALQRQDCWMSFSEALEQYLKADKAMDQFPEGSCNWCESKERLDEAKAHMDALTDSTHLVGC